MKNKPLETIELWTDGSVRPTNPGPHGGWGAIIVGEKNGKKLYRALSGYYSGATNQRSEAYGALHGLQALNRPCTVHLFTDSQYVIRCIQKMQRSLQRSPKNPTLPKANHDIWSQFTPVLTQHTIKPPDHVFGHTNVPLNEWADRLAYNAAVTGEGIDQYYEEIPANYRYRVKA